MENGDNGFLFNLDQGDLTDKMVEMLARKESWERMGKRSLARIQPHDMPNALARVEELYCETIAAENNNLVSSN